MNIEEDFNYFKEKEIEAINLPYKKDNLEAMIILPKKTLDINKYINS